jgi:lipopolysaccharide export system protein LptA
VQESQICNNIYFFYKALICKDKYLAFCPVFLRALVAYCLVILPFSAFAQQSTKIILQSSERSRIMTKSDITYLRKPVFRQDNAILTCDSAVFFTAKNYFEAYDNVHINQADTINIYSDRLTYDGNSKIAHLSSNVTLKDRTSTLTTNILDYNMTPKIGTYVNGGKIINKDATITSKNGYYFANTRDAYFRYNVLVVTEQSTIKSDTLRYNTLTNWAYFYGPTNIKEKDGNLYTENGAYNTKTTYAYFGKNNLYTSGSRSLKGDSLYYDGIAGYGKAVRNIVFKDTVDKMLMHGQLGYYYKKDQRTLVTRNAYAGMGTTDSILVKDVKQPDSLWLGADTLETQMVLQKSLKLIKGPAIKKDNELGEEVREVKDKTGNKTGAVNTAAKKPAGPLPDNKAKVPAGKPAKAGLPAVKPAARDSLKNDSLALKMPPVTKKADTLLKKADSLLKKADGTLKKDSIKPDSIRKQLMPNTGKKDSLPVNPADTVLTRIIKAYHQVNVFKTNMQAKADSLFYTSADSTLRWYRNPILWAQGSQQTGDTIYLQLRNKKINSVQVIQNAFAVNVDTDSAKFNQIKGKMITGFFKEGKLSSMYVDGNAESVYFTKTDDGKTYDKMNQTISSRIKIIFRNNEISDVVPIKDVEGATTPVAEIKQDVILTGFIWKPELRPRSKREITNPKAKAKPAAAKARVTAKTKTAPAKPASGKPVKSIPAKIPPGLIKVPAKIADSITSITKNPLKAIDSAIKAAPGLIKKADSVTKQLPLLKKQ